MQAPSLEFIEQPEEFSRFRYESEIDFQHARLGGCLHGRTGDSVQLRVRSLSRECVQRLRLVVCTANAEDRAPHPHYLHGDGCSRGFFVWERDTATLRAGEDVVISLSRLCIVCSKKTPKELKHSIARRKRDVPLLHDQRPEPTMLYNGRNVDSICLACSLTFTQQDGVTYALPTLFSDTIRDHKQNVQLKVQDVNPTEFPIDGGVEFGIYCQDPINSISKDEVQIKIVLEHLEEACHPHVAKKHLLVATVPSIRGLLEALRDSGLAIVDERVKAKMRIDFRKSSSEFDVIFDHGMPAAGGRAAHNLHNLLSKNDRGSRRKRFTGDGSSD